MPKANIGAHRNRLAKNDRLAKASRTEPQLERLHQRDIIVIGGSAGSIPPLKSLVSSLPADLPAAIFITVHVSAESPSLLPAILTRAGQIPAVHPLNRQPIMKSTIYVAPPDQHLLIEDGCVLSSRGPRENLHRPAIDPLFRSAARAYGPRVMGIILSGLLDDGSSGLMAVKLRGGATVVQDPAEATFPEMPERAWKYAGAQYVLPVEEIQALLVNSANGANGQTARAHRTLPEAHQSHKKEEQSAMSVTKPADKALAVEAQNADLQNPPVKEQVGRPSPYACPDCHGVLWETQEGTLLRFRCRVGHSYTMDTLNVAMSKSTEDTLWASLRALEEKADLLRRMASRAEERAAARYEEEAQACENHAAAVREMLAGGADVLATTGAE